MDRERVDWLVLAGRHPHVGPGRGCLWDRVWDRAHRRLCSRYGQRALGHRVTEPPFSAPPPPPPSPAPAPATRAPRAVLPEQSAEPERCPRPPTPTRQPP